MASDPNRPSQTTGFNIEIYIMLQFEEFEITKKTNLFENLNLRNHQTNLEETLKKKTEWQKIFILIVKLDKNLLAL